MREESKPKAPAGETEHEQARRWIRRTFENPEETIPEEVGEHIDNCPSCNLVFLESIDRFVREGRGQIPAMPEWVRRELDGRSEQGELKVERAPFQRFIESLRAHQMGAWLGLAASLVCLALVSVAYLQLLRQRTVVASKVPARGGGQPAQLVARADTWEAAPDVKEAIDRWRTDFSAPSETLGSEAPGRSVVHPLSPLATFTFAEPVFRWKPIPAGRFLRLTVQTDQKETVETVCLDRQGDGNWIVSEYRSHGPRAIARYPIASGAEWDSGDTRSALGPLKAGSYRWFVEATTGPGPDAATQGGFTVAKFGVVASSTEAKMRSELAAYYAKFGLVDEARRALGSSPAAPEAQKLHKALTGTP